MTRVAIALFALFAAVPTAAAQQLRCQGGTCAGHCNCVNVRLCAPGYCPTVSPYPLPAADEQTVQFVAGGCANGQCQAPVRAATQHYMDASVRATVAVGSRVSGPHPVRRFFARLRGCR